MSEIRSFPQVGVKIKNIWNHNLVNVVYQGYNPLILIFASNFQRDTQEGRSGSGFPTSGTGGREGLGLAILATFCCGEKMILTPFSYNILSRKGSERYSNVCFSFARFYFTFLTNKCSKLL